MSTEHINHLLSQPANLAASDLPDLRQLVQDYPWCQSFQVLYAKALKLNDDPGFNHQLKKTAVYATDRKILYRLIMQPGLQKSIADFEQLTANSEVPDEAETEVPKSTPEKASPPETDMEEAPSKVQEQDEELDNQNLEKEVLKEVAAQSYQIEFESKPEKAASIAADEEPESEKSKPKQTSPAQPLSFIDFITGGHAQGEPSQVGGGESDGAAEESLIERFIQNEPKIERKKSNFFSPVNMGKMSLVDNDEMVSETLAGIYARQGDLDKARRAYEQLALKYPEKSSYFAALIKKLEESKQKK